MRGGRGMGKLGSPQHVTLAELEDLGSFNPKKQKVTLTCRDNTTMNRMAQVAMRLYPPMSSIRRPTHSMRRFWKHHRESP